jgi:hypothetical protein
MANNFQHLQEPGVSMGFLWDLVIHMLDSNLKSSFLFMGIRSPRAQTESNGRTLDCGMRFRYMPNGPVTATLLHLNLQG